MRADQRRIGVLLAAFRVDGLRGEFQDFKMPAWHPGYYRMIDDAKNVASPRVRDNAGRTLPWEHVTKNAWRVVTGMCLIRSSGR